MVVVGGGRAGVGRWWYICTVAIAIGGGGGRREGVRACVEFVSPRVDLMRMSAAIVNLMATADGR